MLVDGIDVGRTPEAVKSRIGYMSQRFSLYALLDVNGDQIVGTVKVTPSGKETLTLPWTARRTERSGYFAPTGTAMFQPPPD